MYVFHSSLCHIYIQSHHIYDHAERYAYAQSSFLFFLFVFETLCVSIQETFYLRSSKRSLSLKDWSYVFFSQILFSLFSPFFTEVVDMFFFLRHNCFMCRWFFYHMHFDSSCFFFSPSLPNPFVVVFFLLFVRNTLFLLSLSLYNQPFEWPLGVSILLWFWYTQFSSSRRLLFTMKIIYWEKEIKIVPKRYTKWRKQKSGGRVTAASRHTRH